MVIDKLCAFPGDIGFLGHQVRDALLERSTEIMTRAPHTCAQNGMTPNHTVLSRTCHSLREIEDQRRPPGESASQTANCEFTEMIPCDYLHVLCATICRCMKLSDICGVIGIIPGQYTYLTVCLLSDELRCQNRKACTGIHLL